MSQATSAAAMTNAYLYASRVQTASVDPFVRRLHTLYPFEPQAVTEFAGLIETVHTVPSGQVILEELQSPTEALVLLQGMSCHARVLQSGRRQMTGLVLPGDFCDYGFLSSSPVHQSVYSLGQALIGRIDLSRLSFLGDRHPGAVVAVLRAASIDQASTRELAVSLGARDAVQRLACFLCEIYIRMRGIGLVDHAGQFPLAVTQAELGEALGLSTVHVNRTIQELRRREVISMSQGNVRVPDIDRLAAIGSFNGRYLKGR